MKHSESIIKLDINFEGSEFMKKAISILICLGILGCMSACSNETTITKSSDEVTTTTTTTDEQAETMDSEQMAAIGDIEVDEGLLTVTVTVPADLVDEGTTQESIDEAVKSGGYISGTLNDDGSVTYVMTKAKHDEVMKSMAESFDQSLQELIDSGSYPNILSITHNDDFTDFTIEYAGDEVGLDSFTVLVYYMQGAYYGVFNGSRPENVHVAFVNSESGEVITECNSRDMASSESE